MKELETLLEDTSRTFALCIPLLPEPTRREVTVAYLLFRIADTFEDAASWSQGRRIEALQEFSKLLDTPSTAHAERLGSLWVEASPSRHAGYLRLLNSVPLVLTEFLKLDRKARKVIKRHTLRTAEGMANFVALANDSGKLELRDFSDLKQYCYIVAGIVGEMLTELYLLSETSLAPLAGYLRERARFFGEGLQLTNILKDSLLDVDEGRSFLPRHLDRTEVFDQARRDLNAASEYTLALQRAAASRGVVAFNALPVLLARATLSEVEARGPGAKLTRIQVMEIVARMNEALEAKKPVLVVAQPDARSSDRVAHAELSGSND